ncbi:Stk1 family PASTA domain-containing Ser/Thr kinase [Sporosarcina sp. G11-34]|uniref:Stk1 family PASTA domain-containing Ser/Thr kinase n=1 Tax=Sporosarcina sp. G11-34 TaxID=2849605 RepID=UPI0022A95C56|nr:Stk1 family PASTA domain-containing Ser/Thr kinase [Sporosarcina sp. G11-34]MCZ2258833.1 Stk1 family PASTA domain-containing Ser/Thr kinase [Sporosarcina sp. G11-34]
MIGRRVGGRYEIIKYIGGGGMSKVYLAHDVILDRNVAIKILNYDFSNEEDLKKRFMREALSATSLTHPHIVDIFDVGEEGELHYLVMEYVEGQTLKEFITSNGPLSPEAALPIMHQLISAISNAHYNGIVHRDIKPQNILMDSDGNVKITDFGIAMALSATAHTKTNSILGTVHYLSPEQARGGMATKKSDIYSVGIVFYELLTGKLPFSGESAVSIALKHLQEETPSVRELYPSIPQSVENVILKATTKNTSNRYQSADEMQDDLATVLLPQRANEKRFAIPYDDDMTRAIPVITDANRFENVTDTKKVEPVQLEPTSPGVIKKKKKWPIVVSILSGILVIALLILFLPGMISPKKVEITDVIGKDEVEATKLLEEDGFVLDKVIEQTSDEFEMGQVIQTNPEVGRSRDFGSPVSLYVSIGKETDELEDYTGRSFTQVASLLANYVKSIESEEVFSDQVAGLIISQDPAEGTEIIPSETVLKFKVSKGEEVVVLEDLSGYDKKELAEYEKSSGLKVTISKEMYSGSVPAGRVISQQPAPEAEIAKGGSVSVVLSQGVEKKPVKHIVSSVLIEYKPELADAVDEGASEEDVENPEEEGETVQPKEPELKPQQIRIFIQDRNHSMNDVFEEFMITTNLTKRITIELEEGQSGAYRIMRDNMQIAEEKFNYADAN